VLAGRPAQPLQLIDVRDLATFTIEAAEAGFARSHPIMLVDGHRIL
jgi:hypothetical protein